MAELKFCKRLFEGMAVALQEQLELNNAKDLTFEERLALLIDREFAHRDNRRFTRRLRNAKLKQHTSLEDIDYKHPRSLDKPLLRSLSTGDYLKEHHNVPVFGAGTHSYTCHNNSLVLIRVRDNHVIAT
jgi:DNA replication protein DnaC